MEDNVDLPNPRLIVGLGNPGPRYTYTRHNIGFLVLQRLANALQWSFKDKKSLMGTLASGRVADSTVHLLMPQTYMNLSGQAVKKALKEFNLSKEELLVLADDVNLPYGDLRLRPLGGTGGHNGLKDIQSRLGTQEYPRLRFGVGAATDQPLADYVLGNFSSQERETLDDFLEKGCKTVLRLCSGESFFRVMKDTNTKGKPASG